jgi:long-subunit fatty acid transport protein
MKNWTVCAVLLGLAEPAAAGGMVLPVRGVRTLQRAGALVAGAEDADAQWLDPPGLANVHGRGTRAFLFDVAYIYQPVDYAPTDAAGIDQQPVSNQQPGRTPIPTLAAALAIDDRTTLAAGITAPYAGLHRYPAGAAQRYASVSLDEASIAVVTLGAAYRISDSLRVGATLQNVVTSIESTMIVSACLDAAMCAATDARNDSRMSLAQTDYFSPTGSIGAQLDLGHLATLGLAVQGPARVAGSGTLRLSLPASTTFQGASVHGDAAALGFTLPPVIRAGVELHPAPWLRVEAALSAELWSVHDEITIEPDGIRVENVQGINAYDVHAMRIPRDYQTSFSPALAVEVRGAGLMAGAGIAYETAAAPAGRVSVLTVDADKLLVGVGAGYAAEGWQIGGAFGYVAVDDVELSGGEPRVLQLQPLSNMPTAVIVNGGTYRTSYVVAGIRAARQF